MAFVHDDHAVGIEPFMKFALFIKGADHGDVNDSRQSIPAALQSSNDTVPLFDASGFGAVFRRVLVNL